MPEPGLTATVGVGLTVTSTVVVEAVPQASVTVTVYVVVPTGGLTVAFKPLVLTTGPPVQTAVNGVEPFNVLTVNTVFGVALQ